MTSILDRRPTMRDCRFTEENKKNFRIHQLSYKKFRVQFCVRILFIPFWIDNVLEYYSFGGFEDGPNRHYGGVIFTKKEYAEEFIEKCCRKLIKFNAMYK